MELRFSIGRTALAVDLAIYRPWGEAIAPIEFVLESSNAYERTIGLANFGRFCHALAAEPVEAKELVGRCGALRVATAGDVPTFAAI